MKQQAYLVISRKTLLDLIAELDAKGKTKESSTIVIDGEVCVVFGKIQMQMTGARCP